MTVPSNCAEVAFSAAERAPRAIRVETTGPLLSKLPRP